MGGGGSRSGVSAGRAGQRCVFWGEMNPCVITHGLVFALSLCAGQSQGLVRLVLDTVVLSQCQSSHSAVVPVRESVISCGSR